jgi:hypothetical protein
MYNMAESMKETGQLTLNHGYLAGTFAAGHQLLLEHLVKLGICELLALHFRLLI